MEHLSRRWSDVFIRSRVSPCVFNVRRLHRREPTKLAVNANDNYHQSTVLLDGLILFTGGPYGWEPGLKLGERVVGYRPFRLLCVLRDQTPPRQLKGENSVPDPASLVAEFECQTGEPVEPLRARTRLCIRTQDQSDLVNLVRILLEEQGSINERI